MKLLQTLSLLALFLMLAPNKVQSQGDHTEFQIDSFDPDPAAQNLIYKHAAHVPSDAAYLRLTRTNSSSGRTRKHTVGRVSYSPPVKFWEPGRQANFETTIRFLITPTGHSVAADGLAFFIAPVDFPVGDSGGNFGVFNSDGTAPNVFAVEFDIYVDPWDPSCHHIGIDITSRESDCVTRLGILGGQPVHAQINYDVNTRRISVVATFSSQNHSLSYEYDLKTVVPQLVRVGISAATGDYVAVHDILSWHFKSTLVDDKEDEDTYIKQVV